MRLTTMTRRILRPVLTLALLLGLALPASAQTKITNAVASAATNAIVDLLDGGTLVFYGNACPSNADDADSGTVLATFTFATPAFGAASNGEAALSGTLTDTSADGTGTAQCFRAKTSGAVVVMQGTITATGGGGAIELVTTSITATQPVTISTLTYTTPKS